MVYNPEYYWDNRAVSWNRAKRDDEHIPLVNFLKSYLPKSAKVLDIGSGDGQIYQFLQPEFAKLDYHMCDISQGMIDKCHAKTNIRPRKWDGKTLPYGDDTFDAVLAISVWLHVPFADIDAFIKENCRVASGYLFAATWFNEKEKTKVGPHCFQHDYYRIFERLNLNILEEHTTFKGKRRCWVLRKGGE